MCVCVGVQAYYADRSVHSCERSVMRCFVRCAGPYFESVCFCLWFNKQLLPLISHDIIWTPVSWIRFTASSRKQITRLNNPFKWSRGIRPSWFLHYSALLSAIMPVIHCSLSIVSWRRQMNITVGLKVVDYHHTQEN